MKVSAIIAAGGRGKRMGADINKIFLKISEKEIISRTVSAFEVCDTIDEIIIVTGAEDIERVKDILKRDGVKKVCAVVEGGAQRQDSVYNGLCAASGDFAAIHDGARCLITPKEISDTTADALKFGAAAVGVIVKDTLKSVDENGYITGTIDRERTVLIQTPQIFPLEEIKEMHKRAVADGISVTDDCSVFEHYGKHVHVTKGSYDNIKITTPEDIAVGEQILKRR